MKAPWLPIRGGCITAPVETASSAPPASADGHMPFWGRPPRELAGGIGRLLGAHESKAQSQRMACGSAFGASCSSVFGQVLYHFSTVDCGQEQLELGRSLVLEAES